MDVVLPPALDATLEMMGVPNINVSVSDIHADAAAWRTVDAYSTAVSGQQEAVMRQAGEVYDGDSATVLSDFSQETQGHLARAAVAVRSVPVVLDNVGWLVTGAKLAVGATAAHVLWRMLRAHVSAGPLGPALNAQALLQGRARILAIRHQTQQGAGRVLAPALRDRAASQFRHVVEHLRLPGMGPRPAFAGGPRLPGTRMPSESRDFPGLARMGWRKNASNKTNSGDKPYESKEEAEKAAREAAGQGGRSRFRPECRSDDHVHVDYFNKHGEVSHTKHFPWKKKK
ncbi:hypothetical protein E1295_25570 [Nonomuraea mesophila]|uniref:Uncharacterized protein n=1 Tax=Nonomuraea mesophila TaxID=2530382 RepID=A0A4R5F841_9ACTN|nr:hypothetical protein [Nonomuraea mesophila]TDE44112.1 hypothetical protein E1295_25570 [Nonomuraea mesophila]